MNLMLYVRDFVYIPCLKSESTVLAQKANKTKMYKYVKVNVICRIIIAIFAIIFSYLSRDIIVAKIDDRIFWPFNFLLTFPWIFTESDQGGKLT